MKIHPTRLFGPTRLIGTWEYLDKSLGGHFARLCRGFEFYEVKKKNFVIIFQMFIKINSLELLSGAN